MKNEWLKVKGVCTPFAFSPYYFNARVSTYVTREGHLGKKV